MVALTLAEATRVLEPPLTERQLRVIVNALGLKPIQKICNGHPGRPRDAYDSAQILKLHAALMPFLRITR